MHSEEDVKENPRHENRESFMARLRLKIKPGDFKILDFAYDLAKYGHRQQFRDSGARYFEHVRETAIILIEELGITDLDIIIAALLHDMLEDSFLLTFERIEIIFGTRVADLVSAVTKPKKNDPAFSSNEERHQWYFDQIRNASVEIKLIKLADRLHNMRTIEFCAPEKIGRKIQETIDVYLPLIGDLQEVYPHKAAYLSEQLDEAIRAAKH